MPVKIMRTAILISEVSLIIALLVMEHLSSLKAGVMRHMYFKSQEYLTGIYAPGAIKIQTVIAVLCITSGLIYLFKKRQYKNKCDIAGFILAGLILICGFYTPLLSSLNTYVYCLMALELILIGQAVRVLLK